MKEFCTISGRNGHGWRCKSIRGMLFEPLTVDSTHSSQLAGLNTPSLVQIMKNMIYVFSLFPVLVPFEFGHRKGHLWPCWVVCRQREWFGQGGRCGWPKHQYGVLPHFLPSILRISALEWSQMTVGRCPWISTGAWVRGWMRVMSELAVVMRCGCRVGYEHRHMWWYGWIQNLAKECAAWCTGLPPGC